MCSWLLHGVHAHCGLDGLAQETHPLVGQEGQVLHHEHTRPHIVLSLFLECKAAVPCDHSK